MKFMMLMYEPQDDFAARTEEGRKEAYWSHWRAYTQAMREAGVLAYPGNVVQPAGTACTVTAADGAVETRAGSYADTPEQLGGYYMLEVRDADEAVEWASRAPAAVRGSVELRPVL